MAATFYYMQKQNEAEESRSKKCVLAFDIDLARKSAIFTGCSYLFQSKSGKEDIDIENEDGITYRSSHNVLPAQ